MNLGQLIDALQKLRAAHGDDCNVFIMRTKAGHLACVNEIQTNEETDTNGQPSGAEVTLKLDLR